MIRLGRTRPLLAAGLSLLTGLGAVAVLGTAPAQAVPAGVSLNVTTTADVAASAGDCGNTSTTVPAPLSLREATCIANNYGSTQPVTINIPAGHYVLTSGELQPGKVGGSNVSLVGAGAASTIIDGNNASRVLDFDSNMQGGLTNAVSNLTITGGKDDTFGGAGIIAGSNLESSSDSLTITNVTVTGNHANVASPNTTNRPGGGIQFEGGQLTISNSTISNNSAGSSQGSGVDYLANGTASPESLSITGTTFSNNSNVGSSGNNAASLGGALTVAGTPASQYTVANSIFTGNTVTANNGSGSPVGGAIYEQSGALTVVGSTFTGNSATGGNGGPAGGAIDVASTGVATLHDNRFTGNNAPTGSAVATFASINAIDNWWGCSTGPGTSGCDTVSGSVTTTPRLVLTATASPAHVVGPNGSATLTASLLKDSAGNAIAASDLTSAFDGLPVTFSDPPGDATVTTTAGAHSVNLVGGTASIDYHSNTTVGPDNDSVTLDNGTVTDVLEADETPGIISSTIASFTAGSAGSFTISTLGYPSPAISETGPLPSGLTFHDNGDGTATISGTPAVGGDFSITLTATNGYGTDATQTATLSIGQPPNFSSGSNATFVTGQAGSFKVTTFGIPTVSHITESGALPPGVTFTDNANGTATIAGTPTGNGNTYPVTLTASNGVSPNATQVLTIQVNQAPAVTSNPTDQTVAPGTSVSFTAAASGVPSPTVQWQRSTDGGASFVNIAGASSTTYTFTTASGDDGNQYRAIFSNGVGSPASSTAATLRVGSAPSLTSADHSSFVVGSAGSFTITTVGSPSATLSRTGAQFPAWLTLTDNGDGTGALSGTPPAGTSGTYQFTLKAANGFSPAASQVFTLYVDAAPSISSANHTTFTAGSVGAFTVTTTAGFPATTTLTESGGLPSGVTFLDNGDGTATLAGTPAAGSGGTYPVTLTAAAAGGLATAATQSFTLTVLAPPVITSADHATFAVGSAGSFTVTSTAGVPAATTLTESGALPGGVSFTDNGDGTATLAGTPAAGSAGSYALTVSATNGVQPTATQSFTLTVLAPPVITSADHATFAVGSAGSFTVTSTAGVPAATTLTESGALPGGVSFTDNGDGTATLAGTPAVGSHGSYVLTVTGSNGVSPDATQSFTLTVTAPPSISSVDHADFTVGSAGSFAVTTKGGFPAATALTESGALPGGVSFTDNGDGTATLAGTPAAGSAGSYALTVSATNGVQPTGTQSFTLTVLAPPVISSADHATFAVGSAGSFTVTSTAGVPAATTLTESGALPGGVSFTDNGDGTATLAGTPAVGSHGSYVLTVTGSNGVSPDATQSFTLTVTAPPSISSVDHADFTVGSAGSFAVTTKGGFPAATTLTESGALPSGVSFTDNGDGTATLAGTPAAGSAGSYGLTVSATNGVQPTATQSFTLTVTRATQTITVTSADPGTGTVGGTYTPAATSDSGLAVAYAVDPATTHAACSFDGTTVSFDHAGNCVIDFDQAGDGTYAAADQIQVSIAVGTIATTSSVAASSANASYGQSVTATATVAAGSASPGGSVQFDVDGRHVGAPVPVTTGTATSSRLGILSPGVHTVTATFAPTDASAYAPSVATTTVTVAQAPTKTALAVGPHTISATVTAVAPGSGTPTGNVEFSVGGHPVGTAALTSGVAILRYVVPSGATQQVAAVYSGDQDFTGSSASAARHDPRITATLTSSRSKAASGWYRTPVTVRFTCTPQGAPLTGPCPAAITLQRQGAAQSVTRTIRASDGGVATVAVSGINIDRTPPTVHVSGVRQGALYSGRVPRAGCVARDALSGVKSCRLSTSTTADGVRHVRATAIDAAGNTATTTLSYRVLSVYIAGARYDRGAFDVRPGAAYTIVATGPVRPRYYDATVYPQRPTQAAVQFHRAGPNRWTLGVTIDRGMRSHPLWNLGVKIGAHLFVLRVRVV